MFKNMNISDPAKHEMYYVIVKGVFKKRIYVIHQDKLREIK